MAMFFAQNIQRGMALPPQPVISRVEIVYWIGEWENYTSEDVVLQYPDIGLPDFTFDNGASFSNYFLGEDFPEIHMPANSGNNDHGIFEILRTVHTGDFSPRFTIGAGGISYDPVSEQIHYVSACIDSLSNPNVGTSKNGYSDTTTMDVSSLIPPGTTGHTLIIEYSIWAYIYPER